MVILNKCIGVSFRVAGWTETSTFFVFVVVLCSELLAVLKMFFVFIKRFEVSSFVLFKLCPQRIFSSDNCVLQHFGQFHDVPVSQIIEQRDLEKEGNVKGQTDQKNEHDQHQKSSWNVEVRSDEKKVFFGEEVAVDGLLDDVVNDDPTCTTKDGESVEDDSPVDDVGFHFFGKNSKHVCIFICRHLVNAAIVDGRICELFSFPEFEPT